MRKILCATLLLFGVNAFGVTADEQIQIDTEALAMLTMVQQLDSGDIRYDGRVANVGEWVKDRVAEIKDLVDSLVWMYDDNGNGRIDPGPEWDNLRKALEELASAYLDEAGNADGKLDYKDLEGIFSFLFERLRGFVVEQMCQNDLLAQVGIQTPWYKANCLAK